MQIEKKWWTRLFGYGHSRSFWKPSLIHGKEILKFKLRNKTWIIYTPDNQSQEKVKALFVNYMLFEVIGYVVSVAVEDDIQRKKIPLDFCLFGSSLASFDVRFFFSVGIMLPEKIGCGRLKKQTAITPVIVCSWRMEQENDTKLWDFDLNWGVGFSQEQQWSGKDDPSWFYIFLRTFMHM